MTTIPDDMIERVARAIAVAEGFDLPNDMTLPYATGSRIGEAIYKARAAIEAMQPAILAERERCADEIAALREQLAESDRNAERLEALLDPHVSWNGEPPVAILSAEQRGAEREREAWNLEIAKWKRRDYLSLHAGEVTDQEFRTVIAVLNAIAAIRQS